LGRWRLKHQRRLFYSRKLCLVAGNLTQIHIRRYSFVNFCSPFGISPYIVTDVQFNTCFLWTLHCQNSIIRFVFLLGEKHIRI
jgi:hypothetical protein